MGELKNHLEEGLTLNPQFSKRGGILPVAVQETSTGQILMLASVNEEAFKKTLETKNPHQMSYSWLKRFCL